MRNALHVLTDELRRLKASGVKTVHVPDATLAALRQAVHAQSGERRAEGGKNERATPEVETTAAPRAKLRRRSSRRNRPRHIRLSALRLLLPALPRCCRRRRFSPCPRATRPPAGPGCATACSAIRSAARMCGPARKSSSAWAASRRRSCSWGSAGRGRGSPGRAVCRPAGQLLTRMIQAMGLQRQQVYIGNIMNWRPELPTGADAGSTATANPPKRR